jgi:diketogulonate reductase-like aldo/keto reductase
VLIVNPIPLHFSFKKVRTLSIGPIGAADLAARSFRDHVGHNFSLEQLRCLCHDARIQPRFVQNRYYAARGWDRQVREFCADNELGYQGFSLLTANRKSLASPELAQIAKLHSRTAPQIVFRFAMDVGMIPLTGTTNAEHMQTDLNVFDFSLTPTEVERIESSESS